MIIAYT